MFRFSLLIDLRTYTKFLYLDQGKNSVVLSQVALSLSIHDSTSTFRRCNSCRAFPTTPQLRTVRDGNLDDQRVCTPAKIVRSVGEETPALKGESTADRSLSRMVESPQKGRGGSQARRETALAAAINVVMANFRRK